MRQEVMVQRTVREVGGANWPVLIRTTYGKWAVLMKVMLRARKLGAPSTSAPRMKMMTMQLQRPSCAPC
jgi:hypothetical protein